MRRLLTIFSTALLSVGASAAAAAQVVAPLAAAECDLVRQTLEDALPIAPGFRRREFEFPANDFGIKGRICRLLTVASGAQFEGPEIRTMIDMHAHIQAALNVTGWQETEATRRFTERSVAGRDVFAVAKGDAICVSTVLIGLSPGYDPGAEVRKTGAVYLGALLPFEREWWITVDCFSL